MELLPPEISQGIDLSAAEKYMPEIVEPQLELDLNVISRSRRLRMNAAYVIATLEHNEPILEIMTDPRNVGAETAFLAARVFRTQQRQQNGL